MFNLSDQSSRVPVTKLRSRFNVSSRYFVKSFVSKSSTFGMDIVKIVSSAFSAGAAGAAAHMAEGAASSGAFTDASACHDGHRLRAPADAGGTGAAAGVGIPAGYAGADGGQRAAHSAGCGHAGAAPH